MAIRGRITESNLGEAERAKLNLVSVNASFINVADGEISIILSVPTGMIWNELHAATGAGSADIIFKVNGVEIPNSAATVNTTGITQGIVVLLAHNDVVTMVISNNASAQNLSISIIGQLFDG